MDLKTLGNKGGTMSQWWDYKESEIIEMCIVNPHYKAYSHTVLYMASLMYAEYRNMTHAQLYVLYRVLLLHWLSWNLIAF